MAVKTSNVVARVEPEVKAQAEMIMEKLGISASTAINMFYRQIVFWNGMPFRLTVPAEAPKALDELTKAEFNAAMETGLAQAKANQSVPVDEAFDRIMGEIARGTV